MCGAPTCDTAREAKGFCNSASIGDGRSRFFGLSFAPVSGRFRFLAGVHVRSFLGQVAFLPSRHVGRFIGRRVPYGAVTHGVDVVFLSASAIGKRRVAYSMFSNFRFSSKTTAPSSSRRANSSTPVSPSLFLAYSACVCVFSYTACRRHNTYCRPTSSTFWTPVSNGSRRYSTSGLFLSRTTIRNGFGKATSATLACAARAHGS